MDEKFSLAELMAVTVARELRDGDHCFIGLGTGGRAFVRAVGVPSVACELAKRAHGKDVERAVWSVVRAGGRRAPGIIL